MTRKLLAAILTCALLFSIVSIPARAASDDDKGNDSAAGASGSGASDLELPEGVTTVHFDSVIDLQNYLSELLPGFGTGVQLESTGSLALLAYISLGVGLATIYLGLFIPLNIVALISVVTVSVGTLPAIIAWLVSTGVTIIPVTGLNPLTGLPWNPHLVNWPYQP